MSIYHLYSSYSCSSSYSTLWGGIDGINGILFQFYLFPKSAAFYLLFIYSTSSYSQKSSKEMQSYHSLNFRYETVKSSLLKNQVCPIYFNSCEGYGWLKVPFCHFHSSQNEWIWMNVIELWCFWRTSDSHYSLLNWCISENIIYKLENN